MQRDAILRRTKAITRNFALAMSLCAPILLSSCLDDFGGPSRKSNDLQEAREFLSERNFIEAEKSFERYLRRNPNGDSRWEVWNKLVDISLDVNHNSRSAQELMEAMLIEYESDPYRLRVIRARLAAEYERVRKNDRAIVLWGALAGDEKADSLQRAEGYRGVARIYLRLLEFTPAGEALDACLELPDLPKKMRTQCRYDLADAYMIMDKTSQSIQVLRSLLADKDVEESLRVQAVFNLADALEQNGDKAGALELFESIKESYPNKRVVEMRTGFLTKNKK